jgi:F-type H+-transporting ATPase subunit delta
MKNNRSGSARRYARALLDVATARGEAARLRDELAQASELLRQPGELRTVLTHPGVRADRRKAVARALFTGRASALLARLVELLADRGRVELLPDVERAYTEAWNAQRNVVAAEATSATALGEVQVAALRAALGSVSGREVELQLRVDPAVLGGVSVKMEDRTYDGTVRAQLAGLRRRLLTGAGGA